MYDNVIKYKLAGFIKSCCKKMFNFIWLPFIWYEMNC